MLEMIGEGLPFSDQFLPVLAANQATLSRLIRQRDISVSPSAFG